MTLPPDRFHLLARLLGGVLLLLGLTSLAAFAAAVVGVASLPPLLSLDGPASMLAGSFGAFGVPLGLSLFGRDARTSFRLRVVALAFALLAVVRLGAFFHPDLRALLGVIPVVEFFVFSALGAVALLARPDGEAPIELMTTFTIDAPAAAVWDAVGARFGDVAEIASGVRSARMDGPPAVGAVRHCESEPFGPFAAAHISEELVEFDAAAMRYAYVAGGDLPSFIPASTNRWSVEPLGEERCRLRGHASIDLVWWALPLAPLIGWSVRPAILAFGRDLQRHMTASRPVGAPAAA